MNNRLNNKRVLIIAAHPDDEVLGMGGTIAKLADEGYEIHLLIVTDGSTSQYKNNEKLPEILEEKKKETRKAAEILGISSVIYGEMPDMRLDSVPHTEVNGVIEGAVEKLQPRIVFTHFWGDVNMDHRRVYESTLVAVRPVPAQCVREVYCYSVPSSTEWSPFLPNSMFMPNVFVDIESYKEQKYAAMQAYKTELRSYPHPRSVEYLKKADELTGLRCGTGAAEAFVLLRKIAD